MPNEPEPDVPRRLGVLLGAFTVSVLAVSQFDLAGSALGFMALVVGGTGVLFGAREGIARLLRRREAPD